MRTLASVSVLVLTLIVAACGGDDETTPTTTAGATGATGVQGTVDSEGMTAEEYLDAPIPDQLAAVEDAVQADPDCEGADTAPGGDLQVNVAIEATTAEPDQPLAEIVAENC
jgi:hypothetical protein